MSGQPGSGWVHPVLRIAPIMTGSASAIMSASRTDGTTRHTESKINLR